MRRVKDNTQKVRDCVGPFSFSKARGTSRYEHTSLIMLRFSRQVVDEGGPMVKKLSRYWSIGETPFDSRIQDRRSAKMLNSFGAERRPKGRRVSL